MARSNPLLPPSPHLFPRRGGLNRVISRDAARGHDGPPLPFRFFSIFLAISRINTPSERRHVILM